jgi:heme-degrading monooxygenase HmoA
MAATVTTGTWLVEETKVPAFVTAWTAFAGWTSSVDGAGTLSLGQDRATPGRYVSFGIWESLEAVHAWKANPEMRRRMAAVLQWVEDFHAEELETVVSATRGDATSYLVTDNQ